MIPLDCDGHRRERLMMGRREGGQGQFFYSFDLDKVVPPDSPGAVYNQMVVKCVFSCVPIETVIGLDERRNAELVRMMRDLVSERRAAGRLLPDAVYRFIEN
jgi:hypothetical protein